MTILILALGCGDDSSVAVADAGVDAPTLDSATDARVADTSDPDASLCSLSDLPAPQSERCSMETAGCVRTCAGDTTCIEGCLGSDASPADAATGRTCGGCTFDSYLSCIDGRGCEDAVEAYRCCELDCLDVAGCAARCATELDAVSACGQGAAASTCNDAYASAADGCSPPRFDSAMCEDTAPPVTLPPEAEPRCSAETQTCVQACAAEDIECHLTCLASDTTDPVDGETCIACTEREYGACLVAGCPDEVQQRYCCQDQACESRNDGMCGFLWCAEESEALDECGYLAGPACGEDFIRARTPCFPPM